MQKRILLSLLLGVIFSISIFSQNLKVEKITLPDILKWTSCVASKTLPVRWDKDTLLQ